MTHFEDAKQTLIWLCRRAGLPVPEIEPVSPGDLRDSTSSTRVRLNVEAVGDMAPWAHASHIFGHYICDLHDYACRQGYDDQAALVADYIASEVAGCFVDRADVEARREQGARLAALLDEWEEDPLSEEEVAILTQVLATYEPVAADEADRVEAAKVSGGT